MSKDFRCKFSAYSYGAGYYICTMARDIYVRCRGYKEKDKCPLWRVNTIKRRSK